MLIEKHILERFFSSIPDGECEFFVEKANRLVASITNGETHFRQSSRDGSSVIYRKGSEELFFSQSDATQYPVLLGDAGLSIGSSTSEKVLQLTGPDAYTIALPDHSELFFKIFADIKSLSSLIDRPYLESYRITLSFSDRSFLVANESQHVATDTLNYMLVGILLNGRIGDVREEVYDRISLQNQPEKLEYHKLESFILSALDNLSHALHADVAPSGRMPVVIGNEAGGVIIHEAIGHPLEADIAYRGVYMDRIGETVASSCVSIIDDPTIPHLRGSYTIDHEGTPAQKTYLIKDGVLQNYLHTRKTAKRFDTTSTGHARREHYACKPIVRMGTTYMDVGTETKQSLIARVQDGLYVAKMGGGQVNPTTGEFIFQVCRGFRIREGKLAEQVRGANISGNGPEMLHNILGVANDLEYFDGGDCGKGQIAPVTDATASVLVHLKVSAIGAGA